MILVNIFILNIDEVLDLLYLELVFSFKNIKTSLTKLNNSNKYNENNIVNKP